MTIISTLATLFGTLMGLANIPQAYRIFHRKSAKDISVITYCLLFLGSIVWILYGLELGNTPIIISNTVGAIVLIGVLIGWLKYK